MKINGEKVRILREEQLLERRELADRAGCKYTTIYKVEVQDHMPRLATARKIAEALSVSPVEIIERETSSIA